MVQGGPISSTPADDDLSSGGDWLLVRRRTFAPLRLLGISLEGSAPSSSCVPSRASSHMLLHVLLLPALLAL